MNDFEESRLESFVDEPLDDEPDCCWLCWLCAGLAVAVTVVFFIGYLR